MKIVAFSDTHGHHRKLTVPDGDVLIFAGDFASQSSHADIRDFADWWHDLPHRNKLFVAGNHDWICVDMSRHEFEKRWDIRTLEDSEVVIGGVIFYGTPWQPEFCNWAFNLPPDRLSKKYELIPHGVDVLITHVPSFGYLDRLRDGTNIGSPELLRAWERVLPKIHIFGHCHEDRGQAMVLEGKGPNYPWIYNVTICDENYKKAHEPMVIDTSLIHEVTLGEQRVLEEDI